MRNLDSVLTALFYTWRPYYVIQKLLREKYGVRRSIRWLKYQFRRLNLKKRVPDPPEQHVRAIIKYELTTSNNLAGYRTLWKVLRDKYHVIIRRDSVRNILQSEDPDGVETRKSRRLKRRVYRNKGPNHIWHIDGYDKLSPYGLTIHGCIDGFSRKLIWLKVAPSNSDPKVIARYFLEALENLGGCPSVLRCDYGTENCSIAAIQIAMRYHHTDARARDKSFIYGPSKANVRIEGFWSRLRQMKTTWWIDLCKNLHHNGMFNPRNEFHRNCLAFVFVPVLKKELDEFLVYWNSHQIRKNHLADCPSGVPNELYECPALVGTIDYKRMFSIPIWIKAMQSESESPAAFYSDEFDVWAKVKLHSHFNIDQSNIAASECKDIYLYLSSLHFDY